VTQVPHPVNRVAHVAGCPGNALSAYLKILVSSLRKQGIESTIFTTEPADIEAEVQSASRIAEELRSSGIEIAFFHASLNDQITTRVASMRPAPVQINVNHGEELDAAVFDGRIDLFESARQQSEWIPPASDIETRLQVVSPVTRTEMGLDSASSISATFGNLGDSAGNGFLGALSEIMKRFPSHFHLFAGSGNVRAIRSFLHSEGVLPRVRFLGQVGDVAPLFNMVDVYLASFPNGEVTSVLEAMGAGKPVVVLRGNPAAKLVNVADLIAPGAANYVEVADRLLRNSALRATQGHAVLERFRAEFRPERLGERYKAFLDSL
jgi:predicted O-linked N-acetylglucosamine transferase (SPINDLY family)